MRACSENAASVTLAEVRADPVLVSRSGGVQEIRLGEVPYMPNNPADIPKKICTATVPSRQ